MIVNTSKGLSMYEIDWKVLPAVEGFDIRVSVVYDEDCHPESFDCYDEQQVKAWRADEWMFVGVIVTASRRGHSLGSASLWGLERGWFPGAEERFTDPLVHGADDFIPDLVEQAVLEADEELSRLLETVKGVLSA
jgi:hypothetical protein